MASQSNTHTSKRHSPYITCGQKSRRIRSHLNRRQPDLLSTGKSKRAGDSAGSVLPRLPMLRAFRRREIPPSTFNEPYRIPDQTAAAIAHAKLNHRRVIAVGTTVTRALESAASPDGGVRAGNGVATGRLTRGTPIRVANAILTGVHQLGESHFELLQAFADDAALNRISAELSAYNYRNHEFGDSILVECRPSLFSERNSNVRWSGA